MITCRRGTTKHLLETHLRYLSEVLDKDWTERDQADWVQAERLLKVMRALAKVLEDLPAVDREAEEVEKERYRNRLRELCQDDYETSVEEDGTKGAWVTTSTSVPASDLE